MTAARLDAVAHAPEWFAAPMPDAELYGRRGQALTSLESADVIQLSTDLLARLEAPGDDDVCILAARDQRGALWRLQVLPVDRAAPDRSAVFRAQSTAASRERLRSLLRANLSPGLAGHVLHDLRNPMNAISLHADLASQIVSMRGAGADPTRVIQSLRIVKERLRDMQSLQNQAAFLWLGGGSDGVESSNAGALLNHTMRQLRNTLGNLYKKLSPDHLASLDTCSLKGESLIDVQLVLIAVLQMVVKTDESAGDDRDLRVETRLSETDGASRLALDIAAPMQTGTLESIFGVHRADRAIAGLQLLLDPHGAHLQKTRLGIRFTLPPSSA